MRVINVGDKLKKLRKRKGLTLEKLSAITGIQIATLSRMENNKMAGTVEAHYKLASTLGVNITELFKEYDTQKETIDSSKKPLPHFENIPASSVIRKMKPEFVNLAPGDMLFHEMKDEHSEIHLNVLEGEIVAKVEEVNYKLTSNESLYFKNKTHTLINSGATTAKLLLIKSQ